MLIWVDIDGDGDSGSVRHHPSIAGTNNFAYENLGNGVFDKISSAIVQDSTRSDGASWGDIDNDGDPDVFVANWYNDQNLFYINEGDWQFRRIAEGPPGGSMGFSESCSWAMPITTRLAGFVHRQQREPTAGAQRVLSRDGRYIVHENFRQPVERRCCSIPQPELGGRGWRRRCGCVRCQ
ncbi:MAG: VCBS repeat-containing protein [Calditrichia bacterium]